MAKKSTLLIVESPAKAKTIEHYLGKGYSVEASVGHLIDLPKSRIAIDVEHGFEPEYITVRGKASILKELEKKAAKADEVLLASDNDREGEAISYHLKCALESKKIPAKIERIIFNEITPTAIKAAVNAPRDIDMGKVNAQKARRVLDRIVGYNLSPILWKKVKNGLSAGRVQSVALRLICDREAEVEAFKAEEYWSLDVELKKGKGSFLAQLVPQGDEKIMFHTKAEVDAFMASLAGKKYVVTDVKTVDKVLNPRAPYTTSKLQQDAAIRLGFTSKKTMQLAQQLYEGISLGSNRVGLITYMRTDSTRISNQALADVRDYIGKNFPQALPDRFNNYSMGKRAQDAHEAIRPTYVKYTPESVKQYLTSDQLKLYTIIWERFVSSQMKDSILAVTTVDIDCGGKPFRTVASVVKEKGFQAALKLLAIKEKAVHLPALASGDELEYCKYETEQHFTQGPSRYTDASIVKILEEKGIGRPSTYAPIITLLIERYYVARKNKQLIPTQLGKMINTILLESFPKILDVNFTAEMEQKLDDVEESKDNWSQMIGEFYKPFKEQVDDVMANLESVRGSMDELTEYKCDKCGRPMVKKLGRFGHFLACSGFPECKNTQSIPFCKCPVPGCDGHIVARKKHGGKGREFYGCTNYPKCSFISAYKPTKKICPDCGYFMVERYEKSRGSFYSCSNTECKNYVKEE
ncbi:MAG: type I DNA topoisomerase [Spirochaetia bacterium]|nr:type I DNA topoisomerase [Spirochaetia bacterium]MBQ3713334.1 type I DNA topoisomerase [Spirochaetia bacterium]